jgi:hypothetical protein
MSNELGTPLSDLLASGSEMLHWVSMAAASPSPAAYLAATLCGLIFGSDGDGS